MGWVLAIDFGTTATCAAAGDLDIDNARLITHGISGTRIPSAVCGTPAGLLAGPQALTAGGVQPDALILTPKRSVARGDRSISLAATEVAVAEVIAAVLEQAAGPAIAERSTPPAVMVLTNPAAWDDSRRAVLAAAAAVAGLPTPQFLSEPEAAAWAVADIRRVGTCVAVFDLGGGTLDCAVLRWDGERFAAVGPPRGVDPLGGEDLDVVLADLVLDRLAPSRRERLRHPETLADRRDAQAFATEIRARKELLSSQSSVEVPIGGTELTITVGRPEFEAAAASVVVHAVEQLAATIVGAGLSASELDAVLLVGDSCRIPLVGRTVWEQLGVEPRLVADGKGAVALGAARWVSAHHRPVSPGPIDRPGRYRARWRIGAAVVGVTALVVGFGAAVLRSGESQRPAPVSAGASEQLVGSTAALVANTTDAPGATAATGSQPANPPTETGPPTNGPSATPRAGSFSAANELAEVAVGTCLAIADRVYAPVACGTHTVVVTTKQSYELTSCPDTSTLVVFDIPDSAAGNVVSLCVQPALVDERVLAEVARAGEGDCSSAVAVGGEAERWYCVSAAPSYVVRLSKPGLSGRADYLAANYPDRSAAEPWSIGEAAECGVQYRTTVAVPSGAEHPGFVSFFGDSRFAVIQFDLNRDGGPDGAPLVFDEDLCGI